MAIKYHSRVGVPLIFLCCYYLIFCFGCKPKQRQSTTTVPPEVPVLPDDFIDFYKKFHQDSVFQLSHIVFPLAGIMQDTSGSDSTVTWVAENWKLHASVTPDDVWAVDFTIPIEGVVVEFIHARGSGYWMERRFAKRGLEWNLIYYSGLKSAEVLTDEEASTLEY